ncbi:hypothetical protein K432DRAFT_399997 [Lepidopterella palustris CBS 459.81]|uniref:RBR-type E3 ubiquitin transferase n=1 Tax=Lepidopterella palustris CBS 459.81 TaxID=1314670 RepID=A0A8E2EKL8_9PEZI|nr:hypothetical protein K432DRAFT_399997 [Lepidopterella palustris CBS 459.81]
MHPCVICGDEEKEGFPLRQTTCGDHYMCDSCLEDTFGLAMRDEAHYHPRCCDDETAVLLIEDYEEYLPFELAFDYRVKEREYSIQRRFRTYCASRSCTRFIHPDNYQNEPVNSALCDACGSLTCVNCKALIDPTAGIHECIVQEEDRQFKKAVQEHGYQECFNCGATIELTEACNHMSCDCGTEFCYVCGREWEGLHGCPHYGQPDYDEEGYNQDGFHKDTGLNREGRTRSEELGVHEENDEEDESDPDGDNEDEEEDEFAWQDIPGMTPEEREMARVLQQIQDAENGYIPEPDEDEESEAEEGDKIPEENEEDSSHNEVDNSNHDNSMHDDIADTTSDTQTAASHESSKNEKLGDEDEGMISENTESHETAYDKSIHPEEDRMGAIINEEYEGTILPDEEAAERNRQPSDLQNKQREDRGWNSTALEPPSHQAQQNEQNEDINKKGELKEARVEEIGSSVHEHEFNYDQLL